MTYFDSQKEKDNEEKFVPFSERKTHWSDKEHKSFIPNVATVLPPGLPPPILKTLLLRMQLEEALYNINHIETEKEFVVWCENALDSHIWSGRIEKAIESRAKHILSNEIKSILREIDDMYPTILPPI